MLCCIAIAACARSADLVRAPDPRASLAATTTPTIVDADGDGIADDQDRCPTEPETKNGYADEDGCADDIPLCEFRDFNPPFASVEFPTGGHTLDADAIEVLERLVRVLQNYPEIKLKISGHTDNRGSLATNQAISLERAEVVRDYLIERGIDPARLTVVGRGGTEPIASNHDEAGRASNRRVDFEIIQER